MRTKLSPEVIHEQRRERDKEYKARWHHTTKGIHQVQRNRPREAEAALRIAEIPEDTRSLSQALLGDPIPNDPRRKIF